MEYYLIGLAVPICVLIIAVVISVEKDRMLLIAEWQNLPYYKIREDLIWKKTNPFYGQHIMPKSLWYMPTPPIYGETKEEMVIRCNRYNQEAREDSMPI
jgi:hypothetical protein